MVASLVNPVSVASAPKAATRQLRAGAAPARAARAFVVRATAEERQVRTPSQPSREQHNTTKTTSSMHAPAWHTCGACVIFASGAEEGRTRDVEDARDRSGSSRRVVGGRFGLVGEDSAGWVVEGGAERKKIPLLSGVLLLLHPRSSCCSRAVPRCPVVVPRNLHVRRSVSFGALTPLLCVSAPTLQRSRSRLPPPAARSPSRLSPP